MAKPKPSAIKKMIIREAATLAEAAKLLIANKEESDFTSMGSYEKRIKSQMNQISLAHCEIYVASAKRLVRISKLIELLD